MKRIILFFVICFSHQLFAQKSFFGVDAGVNIANIRHHVQETDNGNTKEWNGSGNNRLRPSLGTFFQLGLNDHIGFRLSAKYMGMGSGSLDLDYLTLPLTAHYSVNKKLSFNTGVYLSFTLGGTKLNNQPITKSYHQNDRGIIFGGEYEVYKNVAVGVNYVLGLMNIWLADTTIDPITNATVHTKLMNRTLQFTMIYKFRKNTK